LHIYDDEGRNEGHGDYVGGWKEERESVSDVYKETVMP
jgi:hypothetical protein